MRAKVALLKIADKLDSRATWEEYGYYTDETDRAVNRACNEVVRAIASEIRQVAEEM